MAKILYGILIAIGITVGGAVLAYSLPELTKTSYVQSIKEVASVSGAAAAAAPQVPARVVTHIPTPLAVKGVYMTSWVAGSPTLRDKVVSLIDTTEANAVIIDIKDYTGKISFALPKDSDPTLIAYASTEKRIKDIEALIDELHAKNIYVIGRISSFQDASLVITHPEFGVKTNTDHEKLWGDKKGIHWLDAGEEDVWKYLAQIGDMAYTKIGFDELNFDYIRFPSDGNMKDIWYPASEGKVKADVINSFFAYLDTYFHAKQIPISADLFGMTTTNKDDLGIGQLFENAVNHFDFVAPMVYPSHYPATWNGYKNPAANPKEVITLAMKSAVERVTAVGKDPNKVLRPWLQDFDLGAKYTKELVRAQIDAGAALGLNSFMLWDPANTYTPGALLEDNAVVQ